MATWEQVVNRAAAALGYEITAEEIETAALIAFTMEPPRAYGWATRVKARFSELRAAGWGMEDITLAGIVSDRLERWYGYGNDARYTIWHGRPPEERLATMKRIRARGKEKDCDLEKALREETKRMARAYSGFSDKTEEFEDRVRWMEEEEEGCENNFGDMND